MSQFQMLADSTNRRPRDQWWLRLLQMHLELAAPFADFDIEALMERHAAADDPEHMQNAEGVELIFFKKKKNAPK